MKKRRIAAALCTLACLAALPATASAQATRTWVSGTGDDANPCSRTAPCKTFPGAISKTAEAGIIDALDPGGYGTVTITKGVTIDGTGTQASILSSGVPAAVVINAPGRDVTLRNLQISGTGTTCGTKGIRLVDARSLTIEGVTIDHLTGAGIELAPTTGSSTVAIRRTSVATACSATGVGVSIAPGAGFNVSAMLDDVTLTNQATALSVADRGTAYLSNSEIFGNATGLFTSGSGAIVDDGGNHVYGNGTDGSPTTVTARTAAGPAGPAGPAGADGAAGPAGPSGATGPRGAAAKVAKVTCKLRTHRRITCKVTQASTRAVSARLVQAGRTVARGSGAASALRLTATRQLRHGSYRMTLRAGASTVRLAVRL